MSNRRYIQFFQTLHKSPVLLDCHFVVNAADTGGLGITGLKGPGIQAVYMHTSQTPATGNPNPASGIILVQLQDCYNRYFGSAFSWQSPNSGSSILVASAGVTANTTYVITILGTTTTAGWQTLGLPVGITPAVGAVFVAKATTTVAGTGAVQIPKAAGAGIECIEIVGDPNKTIISQAANVAGVSSGAYLMLRAMGATNSSTTTLVATAPADGTVISLELYLSNSGIFVQGE